jgi:glycosyltransferase involved in cell wall biosynthesis
MRIHQFSPSVSAGDGVSNEIQSLQGILRGMGYRGDVWVEHMPDLYPGHVRHFAQYARRTSEEDVLLVHFALSFSRDVMDWLARVPSRKVLIYHNITPHRFFKGINPVLYESARFGREQLSRLRPLFEIAWGDSAYDVDELLERGWSQVGVLPIVFDPKRYAVRPDPGVLGRYKDGPNMLFMGRLVPNKRVDDVILTYYHLKRILPDSRLLVVGSTRDGGPYASYLSDLVKELGLKDVVFAGHVNSSQWTAYFECASVYVNMSEHEGFCVPLVECMHFGVPIIAHKSSALPETLGGAGMLLRSRNHAAAAELAALVVEDQRLRETVVARQRERLQDFLPDRIAERLQSLLGEVM